MRDVKDENVLVGLRELMLTMRFCGFDKEEKNSI